MHIYPNESFVSEYPASEISEGAFGDREIESAEIDNLRPSGSLEGECMRVHNLKRSSTSSSPSRRRSVFELSIALVVGAVVLAACSTTTVTPTKSVKSPYVVHAEVSETGTAGFLGSREARSLKAVTADLNDHGGIDGHPITLDIKNNETSPQIAVTIASHWVTQHVPFIMDGSVVAADAPVDALAGPSGPVMFDLSPGVHPKPGSFVFSTDHSTKTDAEAYLNFFRAKGWTKIAVITATSGSGADGWHELQHALTLPENSGFTVLTHQTFATTSVSVTTQLSIMKATHPQAIVIWDTGTSLGTVLKGMAELGMLDIPTVTTDGNASYAELDSFASIMPKRLYLTTSPEELKPSLLPAQIRPVIAHYDAVIEKAGGHPDAGWALATAAYLLLVHAVRTIGVNATAVQIRDFLQTKVKHYAGYYGIYDMSYTNHRGLGLDDIYITYWDGHGFVAASGPGGNGPPPT